MKLVTTLILLIAVALVALGFIGKQMGLDLFKVQKPKLPSFDLPSLESSDGETIVNKWQDEKGQWHFSNAPSVEGVNAQQVVINPNQNVVQHFEAEVVPDAEAINPDLSTNETLDGSAALPSQLFFQLQKEKVEDALKQQGLTR